MQFDEKKRNVYITSKNYLELVKYYSYLIEKQRDSILF